MIITKKSFIQKFPLKQDVGRTYLSWTVGLLSIVMVFILTAFFAFYTPSADLGPAPSFTVEIPLLHEDQVQTTVLVEKVAAFLKTIPGLQKIEIVEKSELLKLLEPWVTTQQPLEDLKLPIFIDVTLGNDSVIDIKSLTRQLRQLAASIHVEPYDRWHSTAAIYNHTLQSLTLGCIGFIMIIMMMLVSLVTKTSLMAYRPIVDILRLMGAKNTFIARQFQTQALISCLKGGFSGSFLGLLIIYGVSFLPQLVGMPILSKSVLKGQFLPFFIFLPFIIALVSVIVAWVTVNRLLYTLEQ